jgi:hypothetical protein
MSRGFSAGVLSALQSQNVKVVTFAELAFSSGTVYTHNSIGTYVWGGHSWLGVGDFATVSSIQEGAEVSPYSVSLTLSGLDATMSGAALTEDYFMRDVTLYMGLLDDDDDLISTPTQIWSGFMDVMTITAGASGGDSITLTCESELAKFDRSSNLRYTHANQQKKDSTDKFFEFLKDIEGVKIKWKSMKSENLTGSSGGNFGNFADFGNINL